MAGTIAVQSDVVVPNMLTGGSMRMVCLLCTHDGGALSEALAVAHSGLRGPLAGLDIDEVWIAPVSGSAPTDGTSVTISATVGSITLDLLGGAGALMVDATSHLKFVPLTGGTAKPVTIPPGELTITTSGNAVAAGAFCMLLLLK